MAVSGIKIRADSFLLRGLFFALPLIFSAKFKDHYLIKDFLFYSVLLYFSLRAEMPKIRATGYGIIAFFIAKAVSLFFSPNISVSLYALSRDLFLWSPFFILSIPFKKYSEKISGAIIAGLVLIMIYGYMQYFGLDFISWQVNFGGRPFSFLGNPNFLGAYLVAVLPVLLCRLEKKRGIFHPVLVLLLLLLLFFTRTRGSILAGAAVISLWLIFSFRFKFRSRRRLLFLTGVLLLSAGILFTRGGIRINWREGSVRERLFKWQTACEIFKDYPVFGCGAGAVKTNFALYQAKIRERWNLRLKSTSESQVHNDFLQILTETGLVGSGAFLVLLFLFYRRVFSGNDDPIEKVMLVTGMTGILINSLTNFPLELVSVFSVFIFYLTLAGRTDEPVPGAEDKQKRNVFRFFIPALLSGLFIFFLLPELISSYHRKRGDDSYALGGYEKAVFHYEKAHRYSPVDGQMAYNLGMSHVRMGKYDKAVSAFREGIKIRHYGELYNDLGNVEYLLKNYDGARQAWQTARRLGLPDAEAYAQLERNLKLIGN